MPTLPDLGRWLLFVGLGLAGLGLLLILLGRLPWLGRLPGDIRIQRDGFSCFFPLATSLLLSLLLTVLLNVLARMLRR
ncbi:MAG: DUF2905 domain-containing protein [Anaerolineae bacterium]|nr:DUF2905 domain-containing protein [Anaerolineae bacterium]